MTGDLEAQRFKVVKFESTNGSIRGIIVHRFDFRISAAGSLYEAALSRKYSSYNSLTNSLSGLSSLLSWAECESIPLERRLLRGEGLSAMEIDRYCIWLEMQLRAQKDGSGRINSASFNAKILHSKSAIDWFVTRFLPVEEPRMRARETSRVKQLSDAQWSFHRKRNPSLPRASDLSDDTISQIEAYLFERLSCARSKLADVSCYLTWRLGIEFGLRIGEILSIRVEDCPNRFRDTLKITRVEERDDAFPDPRGAHAPRPKTLSRELVPLHEDSRFPLLFHEYVSEHRHRRKYQAGRLIKRRFGVDHPFLLVNEQGAPLSASTAKNWAERIASSLNVRFHWHLARHAFFNRAWNAVASIDCPIQREIRRQDLVYWGGWSSCESLNIYARKAQADRAKAALSIWNGSKPRVDASQ